MPYYGFYWDPTYMLVVIGAIICMIASAKVRTTYNKYSRYASASGMTGAQVAEQILRAAGIYDVQIRHVSGSLTDHYDPRTKVVNLSDSVYNQTSVAAIGVAAHECGHVVQHAKGYAPITWRTALVPVANFGSTISWPLIILGLFLGAGYSGGPTIGSFLITLGIWAFSFSVLFQLVTLPVEFNASHRAMIQLREGRMLSDEELKKTRKVLTAAALTYVAGAASALLQLLRLILIARSHSDDE